MHIYRCFGGILFLFYYSESWLVYVAHRIRIYSVYNRNNIHLRYMDCLRSIVVSHVLVCCRCWYNCLVLQVLSENGMLNQDIIIINQWHHNSASTQSHLHRRSAFMEDMVQTQQADGITGSSSQMMSHRCRVSFRGLATLVTSSPCGQWYTSDKLRR